jgi:hypothetical protein
MADSVWPISRRITPTKKNAEFYNASMQMHFISGNAREVVANVSTFESCRACLLRHCHSKVFHLHRLVRSNIHIIFIRTVCNFLSQ